MVGISEVTIKNDELGVTLELCLASEQVLRYLATAERSDYEPPSDDMKTWARMEIIAEEERAVVNAAIAAGVIKNLADADGLQVNQLIWVRKELQRAVNATLQVPPS